MTFPTMGNNQVFDDFDMIENFSLETNHNDKRITAQIRFFPSFFVLYKGRRTCLNYNIFLNKQT